MYAPGFAGSYGVPDIGANGLQIDCANDGAFDEPVPVTDDKLSPIPLATNTAATPARPTTSKVSVFIVSPYAVITPPAAVYTLAAVAIVITG